MPWSESWGIEVHSQRLFMQGLERVGNPERRSDDQIPAKVPRRRRFGKEYKQLMKFVRRTHMYTGLILLPWVLLFGASGVLFNHPTWLSDTDIVYRESGTELRQIAGFEASDPLALAGDVVERLNEGSAQDQFELEQNGVARLGGRLYFSTKSEGGQHVVRFNMSEGTAWIESRPYSESATVERPAFSGSVIEADFVPWDDLENGAQALLARAGIEPSEELKRQSRSAPQLLFQVRDQDDRLWNTVVNLQTGAVDGRLAASASPMGLRSTITRLHKLHVYPDGKGARWLWAIAGDATGLMMVFWGLSGAIMWWQIKPTRLVGIAGLSIAAVVAFIVTTGTLNELSFGPPRNGEKTKPTRQQEEQKEAPASMNLTLRGKPLDLPLPVVPEGMLERLK